MKTWCVRYTGVLFALLVTHGAHAASVNTVACTSFTTGATVSCATGIQNLNVLGGFYDVTFRYDSFDNLNAGGNFPFMGLPVYADAANATIVDLLNLAGITLSYDSVSGFSFSDILVPFQDNGGSILNYIGQNIETGSNGSNWQELGTFEPNSSLLFMYATFSATVPVPATVWLFGSGMLGLIGVARRNKRVV